MTTTLSGGQTASQACNSTGVIHSGGQPRHPWAAALAADIDPVVVDRLTCGMPVAHTSHERRAAVTRLHHAGYSQRRIAEVLRVAERQVNRDLERAGLTRAGLLQQRRHAAAERRAAIPVLLARGLQRRDLARIFAVSATTIKADCRALSTQCPQAQRPAAATAQQRPSGCVHPADMTTTQEAVG